MFAPDTDYDPIPVATGHLLAEIGIDAVRETLADDLARRCPKNARKGRLVYVARKLQTRRWPKGGEDSDRFSTEILLVPGSRIQFLDWPGAVNGNGARAAEAEAAANGSTVPDGEGADPDMDSIPF